MKDFTFKLFLLWIKTGEKQYTKEEEEEETDTIWETLEGIAKKCPDFPVSPMVTRKHIPFYRQVRFRVAAVIVPLFIAGATIGVLQINTPGIVKQDTTLTTITINAVEDDKWVEMPDGSTIRLEEGALLEYQSDFIDNRVVKLSGGAFFNVAKRNGKSFEVNYGGVNVRVLGTEFHLCEHDESIKVTLCSGSVEVSSSNYKVILKPHQQFSIDNNTGTNYSVVNLNERDISRVYHGSLRFKDTLLKEALRQVGDYFGFETNIATLKNVEPIRMTAGIHDSLEDVLYMLQLISNNAFTYRVNSGEIVIETN